MNVENQQINMILEAIKLGALSGVSHMVLADLAACAQTVIFGSSLEDATALKEARRLMDLVAAHRANNHA